MKKTYMIPTTEVIHIKTMNIMVQSDKLGLNSGEVSNPDELLSRRGGLWNDEEDEDY